MASQPNDPPNSTDEKTQNTEFIAQVTQPTAGDNQNAQPEVTKESSPTSVFVNSEPIREDQVQNAVKFLSHPKVRGSPVMYRRSFLERKGLTKEEIDEAFRRVPDPTPAVTSTPPDGQIKPSSSTQQDAQVKPMQPAPMAAAGSISKVGTLSRFHWSHALLAVGFLAASGAGTVVIFKNAIIPRLKSWIRKVVLEEEEGLKKLDVKPSLAEETAAAAKAAAAAAADVARASQEMALSKAEEKRYFEELISMLNTQVREMKSMSYSIQKLEGQSSINGRMLVEEHDGHTASRQPSANGKLEIDSRSVRSLSPPPSVEPSAAPHPKSYMEIMAMIQRGERPSNIREINDAPPNPNQPVSNPRLAPKPKPWEVGQAQSSSTTFLQSQESSDSVSYEFRKNQLEFDDAAAWQRRNARITEIETSDEKKFGSSNVLSNERPIQRSWVPPQPPPVAMPEAAAAIRQPKKPVIQNEQLSDDQLLARSSDLTDELQRITKISESGGAEANGGSSGLSSSEIQKEDDMSYVEA